MAEQDESLDVMIQKLLRVAIKRRWWLLVPTVVGALCACAAAIVLPNHYTSVATLLVAHQQVPERYVTPNSTGDIREQLLLMTDAILSRTQLLRIIDEFDLYPKDRKRSAPEDLVDLMRSDITIEPTAKGTDPKDLNSFTISFTSTDPHMAQEVTGKLTTLFTEEYLKSREEQSTGTTNFLDEQLQASAADLKQQESRLRDFKMRYLGQLPEQRAGKSCNPCRVARATSECYDHYKSCPPATGLPGITPLSVPKLGCCRSRSAGGGGGGGSGLVNENEFRRIEIELPREPFPASILDVCALLLLGMRRFF